MLVPHWNYRLLPPAGLELDVIGASIDPGRALSGANGAIDMTGGGMWTATFRKVNIYGPDSHLYWNQLRNILTGSVRAIVVPFNTDWVAPSAGIMGSQQGQDVRGPLFVDVPFSDGSTFSDGSMFEQATVAAVSFGAAALGAGTMSLTLLYGRPLVGGETFSISHPTKGDHPYSIMEVDGTVTNLDGSTTYTVGIRPTLREAVPDATVLSFARPKCKMRLKPGTQMAWAPQNYWQFTPDVTFIEHLG